ncbi:MAG TPA: hypothetical protein VIP52_12140 [Candidatus Dormibacteraeota bacterium]
MGAARHARSARRTGAVGHARLSLRAVGLGGSRGSGFPGASGSTGLADSLGRPRSGPDAGLGSTGCADPGHSNSAGMGSPRGPAGRPRGPSLGGACGSRRASRVDLGRARRRNSCRAGPAARAGRPRLGGSVCRRRDRCSGSPRLGGAGRRDAAFGNPSFRNPFLGVAGYRHGGHRSIRR